MCRILTRILTSILICSCLIVVSCPSVLAEQLPGGQQLAIAITGDGCKDTLFLTDGNTDTYKVFDSHIDLTVTDDTETIGGDIGSLYMMFDTPCGEYAVTDNTNGISYTAGSQGYLHEYIRLERPSASVTLHLPAGVSLSEIKAFRYGADPQDIQIWQPPLEGDTDLMLMSAHGDDEHLFFGGILPLYAGEMGYRVQVVYLTDHRNLTLQRTHEMLDGLWAVGVRNYPIFGPFADFRIDSLEQTYSRYEQLGTSKEDLLDYVVTQIRRFRPQVVVGHDFAGEYGHGMHMVYADLLSQALPLTADAASFSHSAQTYGLWDVPKTYIHLYKENPIVINFDHPLSRFDGMNAFDVSRYVGFPCHKSQLTSTSFSDWVYGPEGEITSVWDIAEYNPCYYGLYRSTVGPDILKNDFMENTQNSLVRKQQKEDCPAKEEADRLAAQQTRQNTENTESTQSTDSPKQDAMLLLIIAVFSVACLFVLLLLILRRKRIY